MDFTIYAVNEAIAPEQLSSLTEDDAVEQGLSSGELRQALLDRFRSELETSDVYFVNLSLEPYELQFEDDLIETEEGKRSMLTDIENLLYYLEDEALNLTFWEFHDECICVRGEE